MPNTEARATFPDEPASARRARQFLTAALDGWSCDHLDDVAALLVSELVTNAVLHGRGEIDLVVSLRRHRLRVEVHDHSRVLPARKHYSTTATTGRGLLLVERLADSWGSAGTRRGKVVWFELDEVAESRSVSVGAFEIGDFDLQDLT